MHVWFRSEPDTWSEFTNRIWAFSGTFLSRKSPFLSRGSGCSRFCPLVLQAKQTAFSTGLLAALHKATAAACPLGKAIKVENLPHAGPFLQVSTSFQNLPAFGYFGRLNILIISESSSNCFLIIPRIYRYYLWEGISVKSSLHSTGGGTSRVFFLKLLRPCHSSPQLSPPSMAPILLKSPNAHNGVWSCE